MKLVYDGEYCWETDAVEPVTARGGVDDGVGNELYFRNRPGGGI